MLKQTCLVGVALAALLSAPVVGAEYIYSSHTQDTHSDNTYVAQRFFDRITEATNGEHTFKIAGGGVLAAAASAASAVKTGAVDSAMIIYNYQPSDLPALTLLGDLYSADPRVGAAATTETLMLDCEQCQDEMERENIFVLQNVATISYNLLCANDRISTVADVAGKRIRGTGSMGQLVAALGGTTVNITYQEIYEGLQRGQIDCTALDAGNLEAGQFWDVVDYVTTAPLGTFNSIGFAAVNRDLWNSFTPEQRQAWLNSAATSVRDYSYNTIIRGDAAIEVSVNDKGVELVEPAADLVAAIEAFRLEETNALIETAAGRGVADPQGIVDAYRKSHDKWAAIVADIGEGTWSDEQWDRYEAAIRAEIYSKVSVD